VSPASSTIRLTCLVLTTAILLPSAGKPGESAPRTDRYGDPLPEGAIARLGTLRFRHSGALESLVFSPDGALLAGASRECVLLWNTRTGQPLRRFPVTVFGNNARQVIDFCPDGKTLAVWGPDREITFYDVATGLRQRAVELPEPKEMNDGGGLRFSPDGKRLAEISDLDRVCLIDLPAGRVRHGPGGHRAAVYSLAFSPDSRTLALGTLGPAVQIRDAATGRLLRGLDEPSQRFVMEVAFSPDGQTLAAGSWDRILLVDVAQGKELARLEMPMEAVLGMAFTPDGKTLVSGSQDGKVRLWDVASGRVRLTLDGRGSGRCLALTRDGRTVALGIGSCAVRLWDLASGRELSAGSFGHEAGVQCVCGLADGRIVASATQNQEIRLWDTKTGDAVGLLSGGARVLAYGPVGNWLAAVDRGNRVRLLEPGSGKVRLTFLVPDTPNVLGLAGTSDGKTLVTLDHVRTDANRSEGTSRLIAWDPTTGRSRHKLSFAEVRPVSLALTPDGRTALVGVQDRIRVFDLEEGVEVPGPVGYRQPVASLALSPDGKTLLAGGLDRRLSLSEVVTGREIYRLPDQEHPVGAVAFSPDGRLVASSTSISLSADEGVGAYRIRLWDAATGDELGHFEGFSAQVLSLAFTADGDRLVSGMRDSTLLIWDLCPLRKRLRVFGASSVAPDRLWAALAGADIHAAHAAVWSLSAGTHSAIQLFRKERLGPVDPPDPKLIGRLIHDLDSPHFRTREAASGKLRLMESLAVPALRKALDGKPSPELRRRAGEVLAERGAVRSPEVLRSLRAIQVLEWIGSKDARALLVELAGGVPEARPTWEAKASLERLTRRPQQVP
jgi:WD40 repeat protein